MALIFVDGCDNYSVSADIADRWFSVNTTDTNYVAGSGRYGGGSIVCFDNTFNTTKVFPVTGTAATTDELFFSFSFNAINLTASEDVLFTFQNVSSEFTLTMMITPLGGFILRRGGSVGAIIDSSAAGIISAGLWYRVEFRTVIANGTSGLYELRVSGATVLGPTASVDTCGATGDIGATAVSLSGNNAASAANGHKFDDIIIHNSGGSGITGFLGDVRIETLRPNAAGDSSDSTATGAATRHEAVDEAGAPDDDTTYVAMATSGLEDLYNVGNLAGPVSTVAAVVVNTVSKATAGPRTIAAKVKHSTTEGTGVTRSIPSGVYAPQQDYFYVNPSTSAAWTETEVNAMQIGQEVIS